MRRDASPSPLALFRAVALLSCLALWLRQALPLAWLGQGGLSHLHQRLLLLLGPAEKLWLAQAAYGLGFAGFGWMLWRCAGAGGKAPRPAARAVLLAGQVALALLVDDKLLYLTAAELALLLSWRAAWAALGAQLALMALACVWQAQRLDGNELVCNVSGSEVQTPQLERQRGQLWLDAALGGGFQLLTFGVGCLGAAERRRRERLEATHASLLAARQLLAGAAGNGERLRVARELHDGMGHHLSALNLQLELMLRRGAGEAAPPLRAAREAARQLLAEVRSMVGAERSGRAAPLQAALRRLCEGRRIEADIAPLAVSDELAWRLFAAAREGLDALDDRPGRLSLSGTEDGGAALSLSRLDEKDEGWTKVFREAGA
ncbi:histidine kinase dimerization/phosphoacceptor domain-containing protein [Chromobacterium vaccinii]|uniref:histidine kinase dimerization/phosphoacceptor domain-containing protein n=1 Tax=Chromobacterium vaccinii TaxID=1108595 RepID=UPI001E417995|nr:histidine kinase dimerization/phosphoacceptor domain-containing protein [Chromobacterium vaccinii]MCD4501729.1 histidine kinase dimerization/phosphoacceptor domain-containing protein [Chromobacterium vaccinii]